MKTLYMRLVFLLSVVNLISATAASNFLPDPSFEKTAEIDRFGRAFPSWDGWIYTEPAKFVASPLAHHGTTSCQLVADGQAKIRIFSKPVKVSPGRYKATAWLRALDVDSADDRPMDFAVSKEGPWFNLRREGSFGWTSLTYVFEVTEETELQLFWGLLASGMLWVDEVSLEATDILTSDLTPKPVWGKEEAPIALTTSLGDQPKRCSVCIYRNPRQAKSCFACGTRFGESETHTTPHRVDLSDFGTSRTPFNQGELVADGLRIESGWADTGTLDFSQHDFLRLDIVNPHDKPKTVTIEVHDDQTSGYWTRVNRSFLVPPGESTISLPTVIAVGEYGRPGRKLNRAHIKRLVIAIGDHGPIILKRAWLERIDTADVLFDDLIALDFGNADTPLMEGFRRASKTPYSTGRGMGWVDAKLWGAAYHSDAGLPEALTRDFVCPEQGSFRLDLPNGRYHVAMTVDHGGHFWGEVAAFRKRSITINGDAVLRQSYDADSFKAWYFRHSDKEDIPGDHPYDAYIRKTTPMRGWDVNVTEGKLEIAFEGRTWALSLSSLIVFPLDKKSAGDRFLDWVDDRRRAQVDERFHYLPPPKTGLSATPQDPTIFSRDMMSDVMPFDGPEPKDKLLDSERGLQVTLLQGETGAATFSVQPGKASKGPVSVQVTMPQGIDVQCAWIDYRFTRVSMDGGIFTIKPRYLRPLPAPDVPGITRRFWLSVTASQQAKGGTVKGSLRIQIGTRITTIPLTVEVIHTPLIPITDVAVGPWGSTIKLPWLSEDAASAEWEWTMFSQVAARLRLAGCTTLSNVPHLGVSVKNGTTTLDTTKADREMALLRALGYDQQVSSYGIRQLGYDLYQGVDPAKARELGYSSANAMLADIHGTIDAHAVAANWLPIAWNLADEPVDGELQRSTQVALQHQALVDKLQRTTFMGCTSLAGAKPDDPHLSLARALPIAVLNRHDETAIRALGDAGSRFGFYNGTSRWTLGRYMRLLVTRYDLDLRLNWHLNIAAGDPYFALDCREDDYCWFNTNAQGDLIPSMTFMRDIQPGLNDYRRLATLESLLEAHPDTEAQSVLDQQMEIIPGTDREPPNLPSTYRQDQQKVNTAIRRLVGARPE